MKKRVTIIGLSRFFGGGESYIVKLIDLAGKKVDFDVVSPATQQLCHLLELRNIKFTSLESDSKGISHWKLLKYLFRICLKPHRKPDLIILNGRGAAYWCPLIALAIRRPIVIIRHTTIESSALEVLYSMTAKVADAIVAVSESLAIQHRQKWPSLPIVTIPNWLESRMPTSLSSSIEENRMNLIFAGRLIADKGIHSLVEAASKDHHIDLHFFGEGPLLEFLKHAAQGSKNIHIHGFSKNLSEELTRLSGIFIQPSFTESFSFVVAEAIQVGMVCLLSDIPAHREIVPTNYPDEFFFRPGNVDDIYRSIVSIRQWLHHRSDELAKIVLDAANVIRLRNSPENALCAYSRILGVENA